MSDGGPEADGVETDGAGIEGDADERTVTWRELLAETVAAVGDRQHARWMCETASGCDRDEFTMLLDHAATIRTVRHLDSMVARARSGEPIQYVLGAWTFRTVDLAVDRRVLIPRPETELVAGAAIDAARSVGPTRTAVDLGTGSGAIGLAVAQELPVSGTTVWLTDVDVDALDLARANVAGIGRAAANVRLAEPGEWFDALPSDERFDVIVSNPPYVAVGSADLDPGVAEWEPSGALLSGPDGLDDVRVIVSSAPARLRPRGWLILEHGFDQGPALRALMSDVGLVDVETRPDLAGHDRMTVGRLS